MGKLKYALGNGVLHNGVLARIVGIDTAYEKEEVEPYKVQHLYGNFCDWVDEEDLLPLPQDTCGDDTLLEAVRESRSHWYRLATIYGGKNWQRAAYTEGIGPAYCALCAHFNFTQDGDKRKCNDCPLNDRPKSSVCAVEYIRATTALRGDDYEAFSHAAGDLHVRLCQIEQEFEDKKSEPTKQPKSYYKRPTVTVHAIDKKGEVKTYSFRGEADWRRIVKETIESGYPAAVVEGAALDVEDMTIHAVWDYEIGNWRQRGWCHQDLPRCFAVYIGQGVPPFKTAQKAIDKLRAHILKHYAPKWEPKEGEWSVRNSTALIQLTKYGVSLDGLRPVTPDDADLVRRVFTHEIGGKKYLFWYGDTGGLLNGHGCLSASGGKINHIITSTWPVMPHDLKQTVFGNENPQPWEEK